VIAVEVGTEVEEIERQKEGAKWRGETDGGQTDKEEKWNMGQLSVCVSWQVLPLETEGDLSRWLIVWCAPTFVPRRRALTSKRSSLGGGRERETFC